MKYLRAIGPHSKVLWLNFWFPATDRLSLERAGFEGDRIVVEEYLSQVSQGF
ncbi:hypothetical protein [Tychonema sp. LEGE 07203]|uniref:hypothetical protein n=1 Tax=Tychonema sp. LEGE 07203 TaxID=1828671 RepID=UPI00187DDF56|nr:hypothetical protein [Tychonema sp. LEGE 07203]MBE9095644.1 hypothetical protein [Tychonema sp. LEGE 07203]